MEHDVVIVGGGPAGMMAGLLFARAGIDTLVLEKHGDFLRDFRGDTVHPSTMEILHQLGMLERFLERPHNKLREARGTIAGQEVIIGDFRHLNTPAPFIAIMPQWDFLDFLRDEAAAFPAFHLEMNAGVASVIEAGGRINGVVLTDGRKVAARKLVIAADGRSSFVRRDSLLPLKTFGASIDVFWFRVPKVQDGAEALRGVVAPGALLALIDRGDYWQCAFVFGKGMGEQLRGEGIAALRARIEKVAPLLGPLEQVLVDFDQMHLLTVAIDRLERWARPGLLAIGDVACRWHWHQSGDSGCSRSRQHTSWIAHRGPELRPFVVPRSGAAAIANRDYPEGTATGAGPGYRRGPKVRRFFHGPALAGADAQPLPASSPHTGSDHRAGFPARAGALAGRKTVITSSCPSCFPD
jgi:2-polyprenyl-6-methoxyphenol hydroxylase-like FAD-dependent oxidoreductase